ncbi:CdaR family transcriptional regulator [Gudongella sp. DL1XJH-153]|uniref:CdaR family transcriptional regulator n=1 Tax=Gudongella sp. DL1XJH-153 TaxID=3409804 RepID=UPI003BB6FBA2
MHVPKEIAQNIVEEMKIIINQDINFFNTDSIIIASTDKNRIGDFHGGARKVLTEKVDLLIKYDNEFEGAKKGINVPVYFMNEVVGVIGITGEYAEVEKYGMIIQRMTEILIKEAYIKEQENIHSESIRIFLEELLFSRKTNDDILKTRGELVGVNTVIPRVVILSNVFNRNRKQLLSPNVNEKILRIYRKHVSHDEENLILQSGNNIIMILKSDPKKDLEKVLHNISNDVEERFDVGVYFAFGNTSNSPSSIKRSYQEAKKAMDISMASKKQQIIYYNKLDLGLIINDISENVASEYLDKVFCSLKENEIEEYNRLLETYVKNNGSIKLTSEELFVHKNTLQYRLNKLKELTGYNPRKIEGILVLYLGFLLHQVNNKN